MQEADGISVFCLLIRHLGSPLILLSTSTPSNVCVCVYVGANSNDILTLQIKLFSSFIISSIVPLFPVQQLSLPSQQPALTKALTQE